MGQKTGRNGRGPRYVELLGQPQKPPEPDVDELPSDDEYLVAMVDALLPDGVPDPRPSPAPAPPQTARPLTSRSTTCPPASRARRPTVGAS